MGGTAASQADASAFFTPNDDSGSMKEPASPTRKNRAPAYGFRAVQGRIARPVVPQRGAVETFPQRGGLCDGRPVRFPVTDHHTDVPNGRGDGHRPGPSVLERLDDRVRVVGKVPRVALPHADQRVVR